MRKIKARMFGNIHTVHKTGIAHARKIRNCIRKAHQAFRAFSHFRIVISAPFGAFPLVDRFSWHF